MMMLSSCLLLMDLNLTMRSDFYALGYAESRLLRLGITLWKLAQPSGRHRSLGMQSAFIWI